ncbi:MAG: hypothetical protein L3K17_07515 [Thermoplasmata archaeon]|nr:hypothetical protein [Thermoplasmata archaeon]
MPSSDRAHRLRRVARLCLILGLVLGLLGVAWHPAGGPVEYATRGYSNGGGGGGGGGTGGGGTGTGGHSRENVTLNATDRPPFFTPGNLSLIAGDTIGFTVHNLGAYDHTFTLSTLGNFSIPQNDSPGQLYGFFEKNGSLVNLSVAPGATGYANLSLPSSDSGATLEFVSVVPFQFQAGMFGLARIVSGAASGTYSLSVQTASSALAFVPDVLVIQNATTFPISVAVQVSNLGSTQHTFSLAGQNNYSLSPNNFTKYFATHPPLTSVQVPATPGQVVWANFTITGKGAFEFICEIPGHYSLPSGMFGWLYVGYAPAPPPPPPGSALVDTPFLLGAGALLGLAVLFTLAATFVGRFPRQPGEGHH